MPNRETAAAASGKARPIGPVGSRNEAVAAVVATLSVTFPVITALLKVIVLFAELKFESGVVKVKTGKSFAPAGEPVTLAVRVAVPVKPLTTFSMMNPVPDMPGEVIVIWPKDAGVKLNPLTAMVKLPEVAVVPCESVTFTVKVEVPTAEPMGVPEITPALDSSRPVGRAPEFTIHVVYGGTPPVAVNVVE
jgi:hypothetical protein